jgi:8-oxo-dGTP pyrophosphatase MutT (NUDIX family)
MKGMVAALRRKLAVYKPSALKSDPSVRASVLMPILVNDGDVRILLPKRTTTVRHHKGEISFPGGRYEEGDRKTVCTAIRECGEEIGVRHEDITIMGRLDDMVTATGFVITPYVAQFPHRMTSG